MTTNQRLVLKHFYDNNLGAVQFQGQWIFPVHVRDNADLADKLVIRFHLS